MKKNSLMGLQGHSPARSHSKGLTSTPTKHRSEIGTPEGNSIEERRPLTPIQKKKGTSENEMVGRQKSKSADESSSSGRSIHKVQSGFIAKRKLSEKSAQTDADTDIVTSEEPTLQYWRELAEERRAALEEALLENQMLTEKVEALENDNIRLSQLVEEAKTLAEMINSISEDADESGIVKDEEDVN